MNWADLLEETDANRALGLDGLRFSVAGLPEPFRRMIVDPAIHNCEEREEGRTVFVVVGDKSAHLTPDQATAMGMALIKGAAQERNR